MNVVDKIKELMTQIKSLWGAITDLQESADSSASHDLLSAVHPDTTPGSPARGDLVTGQGTTPTTWKKKALGASGKVVQSDGSDVVFDDVAWANVAKAGSSIADLATHSHAALSGIGEDDHHAKAHALDSVVEHTALSNNTNHNVSTTKHGLCPILPNDAAKYLDGEGAWTVPGGGAGGGWVFWDVDKFPASPTSQSDHFDDATIDGKWVNFQTAAGITITEVDHFLKLSTAASDGDKWRGKYQTLPSGDFTITAKFFMIGNGNRFGIALFQDADGDPDNCDLEILDVDNGTGIRVHYFSNWQSYGGEDYSQFLGIEKGIHCVYLRIRKNSTTWYFDYSLDGLGWYFGYNRAERFTAEQFGILTHNEASVVQNVYCDWVYYKTSDDPYLPGELRSV